MQITRIHENYLSRDFYTIWTNSLYGLYVPKIVLDTVEAVVKVPRFYGNYLRVGRMNSSKHWGWISMKFAPYGPRGGNAAWFICWFRRYINCLFVCLFVCLFTYLHSFLSSLFSSLLILSSLLVYFLTYLVPDLSIYFFQNRPVPFTGRRSYRRQPNLALIFLCSFYVCGIFVVDACLLFCWVWFSFFSPVLSQEIGWKNVSEMTYFVSDGTLKLNSVNQSMKFGE